jgi:type I restriction enzyme S subunit
MKWEKVRLGHVTDSCLGKMLDKEKNKGEYQPYLANVDVRWGSFNLDNLSEMRFEDNEQERYGLKYGDLVICEGGEPGRCAIWKDQVPNMKIQKALHRVRVHNCLDYRFLYYWFLLAGKTGTLEQYFTGATIKHMPGEKLKSILIDMPPIETQQQITNILSAYDNLIENNQKQIKLLEEAAQRLYKEWFVDLRFPGHENVKIVDGVPEGWKLGVLADIAVFKRGKTITKTQTNAGNVPVVAGGLEPAYYHSVANTESPVITVSASGANAGFARMYHTKIWASDCSYIDSAGTKNLEWVYGFLKENKANIEAMQKGAAQPHVYAKDLNKMEVLFPNEVLMEQYQAISAPIFERIGQLEKIVKYLAESRDRLLPKLMNREIIT